ncbi:MAG: ATP-binding protein [Kofleriaceae bacterium]|nr:ATP-binding protein [Kofleriaceae bacterium]
MKVERWPVVAGSAVLVVAVGFLACWFSGDPDLIRFAAWRCKTNTCIGLAFGGASLLLLSRGRRRLASLAASPLIVIGAATIFEYANGIDLGIDQLLARDWPFPESAVHPNRMPPHSAGSLVLLGGVLLLAPRGPRAVLASQALAIVVIVIDSAALLGTLFETSILYEPGGFIRISPYAAFAFIVIAIGAMALRPDLGVTRRLRGDSVGAILARRLMVPAIAVAVGVGWVRLLGVRARWWTSASGSAFEVIAYLMLFGVVVLMLARSLDAADARRTESEDELRKAGALTAGLARAVSVEEVARTVIELGLPALGADAGSVFLLEPKTGLLRQLAIQGYTPEQKAKYAAMEIDAATPIADAARTKELVIVATRDELLRRYPHIGDPPPAGRSWAAVPLEGRERVIGVLGLSFRAREVQPAAIGRLQHLAWQCGQALDRALLFEEIQQARDVARDANRAKDSFLAVLGHELRNPLAPITHALELMRARDPSSSRERAVIERQVQHVSHLVDDLLDVSRIAKGKVELTRETVEISEVARDAVEHVRPMLDERRHHLRMNIAPDLFVEGDRARLVQVVSNLLHNAARYTAPGGEIELTAVCSGADVVITVRDNGVGIDPALLPSLFVPFVQGERRLERATGGLGLGLSIVRDLVNLHGGEVVAHSEGEGRGATFTVRLPAVTRAPSSSTALRKAPDPPRATRRVLIVDDNEDAAELMAESLSNAGHATRVAFDGERALEVVDEFDPEFVILDIGLPRIDGYEVARRLRASDAEHQRRRVLVALTGFGQAKDVQRALDAGFDRHLVKPMPVRVALEIIATLSMPPNGAGASPA